MNILIVYDAHFNSVSFVANTVAASFRDIVNVRLLPIRKASARDFESVDFVVVGGGWGMTSLLEQLFIGSSGTVLNGTRTAVFVTHYRYAASGSPTRVLSQILVRQGAALAMPPETFDITDFNGPLAKGEPDRAAAWAHHLAAQLALA